MQAAMTDGEEEGEGDAPARAKALLSKECVAVVGVGVTTTGKPAGGLLLFSSWFCLENRWFCSNSCFCSAKSISFFSPVSEEEEEPSAMILPHPAACCCMREEDGGGDEVEEKGENEVEALGGWLFLGRGSCGWCCPSVDMS